MTTYEDTSSGGVYVRGCAVVSMGEVIENLHAIGDLLYSAPHARDGRLVRVVVKKLYLARSRVIDGVQIIMYKDTYNGTWNENELVTYAEALELIAAHDASVEADIRRRSC